MVVRLSGKSTLTKFVPAKAPSPMVVRLSGKSTFSKFVFQNGPQFHLLAVDEQLVTSEAVPVACEATDTVQRVLGVGGIWVNCQLNHAGAERLGAVLVEHVDDGLNHGLSRCRAHRC